MGEQVLPGNLYRESEFEQIPGGRSLTGACGPNSLSMGLSWARQSYHGTVEVVLAMQKAGLCDGNGVTTLNALHTAAAQVYSLPVAGYRPYGEPWPDYATFLSQFAGQAFICLNVAEGWALVDALTGTHENANDNPGDPNHLRYHLLGVVGRHDGGYSARAARTLPAGWWCVDGDSFSAATLVFYPDGVMQAAQPCGAFALSGGPAMAWTRQADGSGKDDQGHICGTGAMAYLVANGLSGQDGLMSETFYTADASFLPLVGGRIVTAHHDPAQGWQVGENGAQALVEVWNLLQAARQNGGTDPAAQKALAAVAALKAALAN